MAGCGSKKMAKGGMVKKGKGGMMCSPRKAMAMGEKASGAKKGIKKFAAGGLVSGRMRNPNLVLTSGTAPTPTPSSQPSFDRTQVNNMIRATYDMQKQNAQTLQNAWNNPKGVELGAVMKPMPKPVPAGQVVPKGGAVPAPLPRGPAGMTPVRKFKKGGMVKKGKK